MIWIIGGTSEAKDLLDRIKDLDNFLMTIATEGGKDFFNSKKVIVGRLNKDEMLDFARNHKIETIIDLSHPYAKIVSDNAKEICTKLGLEYIRYVRKKIEIHENEIYLNSYEECYDYLNKITGTVFFTTGSKNIGDFENVRGGNRFIYRILPAMESLEICRENNLHMKDIIAILGPFSKELNKAMLSENNADYCVMKDSGDVGGTLEKVHACRELKVKIIIIGREEEEGIDNLDIIEKRIRKDN